MNPDFAIVLNFKLKNAKGVDADFLVKTARNIGARAIATDAFKTDFEQACRKYTIALVPTESVQYGCKLSATNTVEQLVLQRKAGKNTVIDIPITDDGNLLAETKALLAQINNWMHLFGHAFNEGEPCNLTISNIDEDNGFVLQNRHMHYQKYVFIKTPLPEILEIQGLTSEPNRIEMVAQRTELDFTFAGNELTINLKNAPKSDFTWQVIRIQEHRPEDDIKETKY